ncbi:MAG: hypothetical protein VX294_11405 [Candidatus Latescibacterota bacterium]|nr:hypothetical protein [Candidatus Latescibacterota bacterium]
MAIYDSHPRYILAIAVAFFLGILIIGPFSTALQHWTTPLIKLSPYVSSIISIKIITFSSFVISYSILSDKTQIFLSIVASIVGSILGHDATIAITKIVTKPKIDQKMIALFPICIVLALIAGYSSLGFVSGVYQFAKAMTH